MGAQSSWLQFLALILSLRFWDTDSPPPSGDSNVLIAFKSSLPYSNSVLPTWIPGSEPCRGNISFWTGVICENDSVWGLNLDNMSLSGSVDTRVLVGLPNLKMLSLANNSFEGPMPDVSKLLGLKYLYLSNNRFSGKISKYMFSELFWLTRVYLSNNEFTGRIPSSLTTLTKLVELKIDHNKFKGRIPDFWESEFRVFDVSENKLEGRIPDVFQKMDSSLFEGNDDLCGPPLSSPCIFSSKLTTGLLVAFILIVIILLILILLLILRRYRKKHHNPIFTVIPSKKSKKTMEIDIDELEDAKAVYHGVGTNFPKEQKGKFLFVKDGVETFDLNDLFRASAEVLGSGNFGSSYKAMLLNGSEYVVKRFKDMNGLKKAGFHEHMRRIGRLSHPNLLPLVAYYYKKEEKLLITEYIPNGSLAHMLHGGHFMDFPPLTWPTRLKIIKGVARGLAYLYEQLPMLILPHGHLKSSNVLLDYNFEPILTDYALAPVMNHSHASQIMVAYKSPECVEGRIPSRKSDVWSLGILILEILTGKFPTNSLQKGRAGTDLASWVNSVVKGEFTGEVFDTNMKGNTKDEKEMMKLLQIGLACCEFDVNKRLELKAAVEKIEELKELKDSESQKYLSYVSKSDKNISAPVLEN